MDWEVQCNELLLTGTQHAEEDDADERENQQRGGGTICLSIQINSLPSASIYTSEGRV
tara:strand:- start:494 stop:667 length:174 start_codon:yes stop_codon:yes gene_type:complete